ncbi:DNA-binding protein YbiB [Noviherbaspirillum massiliense]|uniref:DNA-binding protein YbiB n=1 Tax=Noviherbaspirillum massiliense TaxID=1465823 RepID=UPI0002F43694|nr:DNA-binding protein YbiB [Noviherbaspirillum massiliense]
MDSSYSSEKFSAAPFIKEIGRGKKGARSMSRDDSRQLYAAMLDGRVSDLELGAVILALRIKGESVDEIAGFLDAAEASFDPIPSPPGEYAPVVIPSYNGSRKLANLTPLLAILLARQGVPVLVHGVTRDPGRVTTAEIFQELGIPFSQDRQQPADQFASRLPAFMPIESLAPRLARLLELRRVLGVRNSTHTLVKIMQPFAGPALRLVSYTHPEYLAMLTSYFTTAAPAERGDAFLMRGTEGEVVANSRRAQQIEWFHGGVRTVVVEKQEPVDELPSSPQDRDASGTAQWICSVLNGKEPIPEAIAEQVRHCLDVSRRLRANTLVRHANDNHRS